MSAIHRVTAMDPGTDRANGPQTGTRQGAGEMPKLNAKAAKAVDNASSEFEVLAEGVYTGALSAVEVREGRKAPYWSWEFKDIRDGNDAKCPGRLWTNTSTSDASAWKMQEAFKAFGVPANTDTDDLLGQRIRLVVKVATIQEGAKAGQQRNEIDTMLPIGSAGVTSDGEPDF